MENYRIGNGTGPRYVPSPNLHGERNILPEPVCNIVNIAIRDLSTNVLVYGLIVGLYFLWASYLGDGLVKINGP